MPQVQTPIFGGFYQSRSLLNADQRCVNLYPEVVENQKGKAVGALYGCPGLDFLGTIGNGPWRGLLALNNGLFGVSGNGFFEVTATFSGLRLGGVGTATTPVGMVSNGLQILIVDGNAAYGYDIPSNTFATIALPYSVGNPTAAAYQDGFFIINELGTKNWWSSNLNDVFTWDALNFSVKDGQPDNIVTIVDNHREVWLFGAQTTEVWINAGLSPFTFQRLQGVFIQEGCAAQYSAAIAGGSILWLSKSKEGHGVVLQSRGYQSARISTHAIEREIQSYVRIDDAVAYTYQQEGHLFYVLSFPTDDVTWCFDSVTGLWHQRAGFDNGEFVRHRSNCCALFQGRNIVGDFQNGNLYAFNLNTYDDAGFTRKWLRSWHGMQTGQTTLKKLRLNRLQIYMEPGVGSVSPPPIRVIVGDVEAPPPPPPPPKIKIVKNAVGGDDTFAFVVTNALPANVSIATVDSTGQRLLTANIGAVVNIVESVPDGWALSGTVATNARVGAPTFVLGVTPLESADDVTVIFTDAMVPPPGPIQLPPGGPPVTYPVGTEITVWLQAGGGAGQNSANDEYSGAGGGAGEYRVATIVSDGSPISYTIGAAGVHGDPGGNGGDTVFGSFTVLGGLGGVTASGDHPNSFGPGGANASGVGGGDNSLLGTTDWSGANGGLQQNTAGGSGGGAASNGGNSIVAYTGSPPIIGGVKGAFLSADDGDSGVGGGGAASPFGAGGAGGASDPHNTAFGVSHPGLSPSGSSYGAGGGGGAMTGNSQAVGADGMIGTIFLTHSP